MKLIYPFESPFKKDLCNKLEVGNGMDLVFSLLFAAVSLSEELSPLSFAISYPEAGPFPIIK